MNLDKAQAIKYLEGFGTPFPIIDIAKYSKMSKFSIKKDGEVVALGLTHENMLLHISTTRPREGYCTEIFNDIRHKLKPFYDNILVYCPIHDVPLAKFLEDIGFACSGEYVPMAGGFIFLYELKSPPTRRPKSYLNTSD